MVGLRLLWKAFGKQILRWLGMKAIQRVQKSFEKRTGFSGFSDQGQASSSAEPAPRMKSRPREKKKVGEYIDFEEID